MYWFCGINDSSNSHKEMYLVALKSAKRNTTLVPILIYDGNDNEFISKLSKYNLQIVNHKTNFYTKPNFNKKNKDWINIATGAFLRIDIPIICKKLSIIDEYVLYTDVDIIFLKDVVDDLSIYKPAYFAICPQFSKDNYIIFNSGVMLINLNGMYNTYDEFTNFI